jgi:hypothetical protein
MVVVSVLRLAGLAGSTGAAHRKLSQIFSDRNSNVHASGVMIERGGFIRPDNHAYYSKRRSRRHSERPDAQQAVGSKSKLSNKGSIFSQTGRSRLTGQPSRCVLELEEGTSWGEVEVKGKLCAIGRALLVDDSSPVPPRLPVLVKTSR